MKAAIFDMDGTLLDSMNVWKGLGDEYLRSLGIKAPKNLADTIRSMSFLQTAQYFKKEFGVAVSEQEMIDIWNQTAMDRYKQTAKKKAHVTKYLEQYENLGMKMCVATATDKNIAETVLKKLGLDGYFEFILTEQEVGIGKHEPDIFIEAANRLGVKVEECIVFEDAYHAIKSAKQAGFNVYAIEDEESKKHKEEILKICDKYICE